MNSKYTVAVTAIIFDDEGRVLLTKRNNNKKKWPGKWTVPGGKVEDEDFLGTPTEINNQWYHTLENAVVREVKEETGCRISNIEYLCNIAVPGTIIVSYTARLTSSSSDINLQFDECDEYAWVDLSTLSSYDLIDGIEHEIEDALKRH